VDPRKFEIKMSANHLVVDRTLTFQQEHEQYKRHVRNQRYKSYPQLRLVVNYWFKLCNLQKMERKRDQQFCIKNSYPPKYKAHLNYQTRRGNKSVDRLYP
jgi:hypothetical protein